MNNTTTPIAYFSPPTPTNSTQLLKSDFCSSLCGMATNVMPSSTDGSSSPDNWVYYIYILLGGLFLISEGIGFSKKIPQGSILELIYVGLKKLVTRPSEKPTVTATPQVTIDIADKEIAAHPLSSYTSTTTA